MSNALMSFCILLTNPLPFDSVRSALEGKEKLWFICLLVASVGVAIGCVLEIPETWATFKEWAKPRKEGAEALSWKVPMAAVGLLLVVLGVIGEVVFEALVSMNETALRAHDEQALSDTIKEAGTAKDSAEKAQKAAELASTSSGEAMGKAKEASGKADTASSIADNAGRSASGALIMAGEAKADVAVIKTDIARLAPRTLAKTKREILVELLQKAQIKSPSAIDIEVAADAFDGSSYGAEIADAINDPRTGWKANPTPQLMTSGGRKKGIFLLVHDTASAPIWAAALQQALMAAGLGGQGANNPNIPVGTAEILIERK